MNSPEIKRRLDTLESKGHLTDVGRQELMKILFELASKHQKEKTALEDRLEGLAATKSALEAKLAG